MNRLLYRKLRIIVNHVILSSFLILIASQVHAQTAIISSPTQDQLISNVYMSGGVNVSVNGTATGPGMANWILDYGSGSNPSTWPTINSGTSEINNALLGTWITKPNGTLLANG
ncbi:hypothetical protein L0244_18780, partial [bacterium]|nr:hypothetical protein [bacterium]